MRELIYPHCERCSCPLARLEGEARHRTLCIRCHQDMAANSQRNPHACCCGLVATCKTCRNREYKYSFTQRNKQHIRDYWNDYYYAHWQAIRTMNNAVHKARDARRKAQRETQ